LGTQEMINRLLAHPTEADAQIFLQGLGESPVFFKRIMGCLSAVVREIQPAEMENFAEQHGVIFSDTQTLLGLIPTVPGSNQQSDLADKPVVNKSNFVSQIFSPKYFYRYATAAAVLVAAILLYTNFFVQPDYVGIWDNSQPYNFQQFGLVENADLKSTTRMRSSAQNPADFYKSLAATLGSSLDSYQKSDYQNAANELAQNLGLFALFQRMVGSKAANDVADDPAFTEKAHRLLQEYRFSLGLMNLALSTANNVDLKTSEREEYQRKAIEQFAEAQALAGKFAIDTDARELYFSGVANRMLGKKKDALVILRKIPPESMFFAKARQEMEAISN